MSEENSPVVSQASRIEGPVRSPSNALVTSRMGMRMIDGKMPK